jgi:hypothetical protein
LEQHNFGFAARAFTDRLDRLLRRQARGGSAIKYGRARRPLDAERLKLANMIFDRPCIASGPAAMISCSTTTLVVCEPKSNVTTQDTRIPFFVASGQPSS